MAKALGPLSRGDVVARALAAVGFGTRYKLGKGGRDPAAAHPAQDGACDCSGFAAWCVGVDRFLPNGAIPGLPADERWFETSALYADARSPWGFVAEVPWIEAREGDLLVWPDQGSRQGHVGVITAAGLEGPTKVAHCASSNWRNEGDAIRETGVGLFLKAGAIAARVRWVS